MVDWKKACTWYHPFHKKGFLGRLFLEFGWRYTIMVAVIYGANQAISLTWGYFARDYYFTDKPPNGINLTPADAGSITALASIPWQIKALYGIASDAFAIRGKHRTPYIIASTFLGAAGWGLLGLLQNPGQGIIIMLLFCSNLAVACPDVMIDATVAERCQQFPKYAVDLQSLCWGAYAFGAIIANFTAGRLYGAFKQARPVFLITAIVPLCVMVPTCFGWITEEKDPEPEVARTRFFRVFTRMFRKSTSIEDLEKESSVVAGNPSMKVEEVNGISQDEMDRRNSNIYLLALVMCAISITIGTIVNSIEGTLLLGVCYGVSVVLVCFSLWFFERSIHMDLVRVSWYIFLKGAIQPGSRVMFFWYRKDEINCAPDVDRPCLEESYISEINVVGNIMMIFGTIFYNKWLSHMSYRKIWIIAQSCILAVTFIDYAWVKRWNNVIGIPDKAMIALGDEILFELMDRFESMPFFILAAKLCPPGLEATLFATMMGLSNFGRDMGYYLGSIVLEEMNISQDNGFVGLDNFLLLRNLTRVAVIVSIPFLVPKGSPMDPSIYEGTNWGDVAGDDDDDEGMVKRKSLEAMVQIEAARRGSINDSKLN